MTKTSLPEVWLRGAVPGVSPWLQPVVHALLQAREEITELMQDFPDSLLWEKPAGLASPGFHLQHLSGVLDRLFTYAEGKKLSEEQLAYLKREGTPAEEAITTAGLVKVFHEQVEHSVQFLKNIGEKTLTENRGVGRAQLPSTVLGLLFHAAEHTMRHTGQLLVTVRVLLEKDNVQ
jgi:uncharacterized damage-inducible protein DinB